MTSLLRILSCRSNAWGMLVTPRLAHAAAYTPSLRREVTNCQNAVNEIVDTLRRDTSFSTGSKSEPQDGIRRVEKLNVNIDRTESRDLFFKAVTEVKSFEQLHSCIRDLPASLNFPHMIFQKMATLKKTEEEGIDLFMDSEEFKLVCASLEKQLMNYKPTKLMFVFNNMCYFQNLHSTLLMKKVLTLILDKINDFSLVDIMNIVYLSSQIKFEGNNEMEALKMAAGAMLHLFMEKGSMSSISDNDRVAVMFYASRNSFPYTVRKKILTEFSEQNLQMDMKLFLLYLKGLQRTRTDNVPKDKINQCLRTKIREAEGSTLLEISVAYMRLVMVGDLDYSEELCDILATRALAETWQGFNNLRIVANILRIGHLNAELLSSVCETASKANLETLTSKDISLIARVLSCVSHPNLKTASHVLKELPTIPTDLDFPLRTRLTMDLILLEIDDEVSRKLLRDLVADMPSGNLNFLSRCWDILLLYSYATDYDTEVVGSFSVDFLKKCLVQVLEEGVSWDCRELLEDIFGGENYVLKNCIAKDCLPSAYVVFMDPDDRPVDVSQLASNPAYRKSKFSDSLYNIDLIHRQIPRTSVLVLHEMPSLITSYMKNVSVPLRRTEFYLNQLEALGFDAIWIDKHALMERPEVERKPSLLSEIKRKTGRIILNS